MSVFSPQRASRFGHPVANSTTPDAEGRTLPRGTIEWPALKRMLDRRDPSYRT
jgi:hypothetical protein